MTECIVLLLSGDFNEEIDDIVLIFAYVAPERSPIYLHENDNEIVILNEKLIGIKSLYPDAHTILAGDLNERTKDYLDLMILTLFLVIPTINLDRKSKDAYIYNKFGLSLIDFLRE